MVALTSSNSAVATVPASATVKAGATAGSFTVYTGSVTSVNGVQINSSYSGAIVSAVLTDQPAPAPSGPSLSSLSLLPTTVRSAASSQGTVTLSGAAPAGGVQINLSSSNASVASVPVSVLVAAGATSATFTVQSSQVKSTANATISASLGSATQKAVLSVKK